MATAVGTISDIRSMIDALPKDGAYLRVPPGLYTGDGTITVKGFTASNAVCGGGKTVIDMEGVWFNGNGYLTLDSCKRLTVRGLRAQNFELMLKGVWWSNIHEVEVESTIFTGPGTSFSSSYWNRFTGGMAQRLVFHEDMAAPANAQWFYGYTIRSMSDQGYSTDKGFSIDFQANQDVQGLRFYGGDISYATQANWRITSNNTNGFIDCIGDGVYFDGFNPTELNVAGPPLRRILWPNNYH
jgi:hypothetical protein